MAEYFVFYKSFYDAINILDSDASQMRIIKAIAEFIFNEKDLSESLSGAEKAIFLMAIPLIKANIRKSRGGAPIGNQNAVGNRGGAPAGNQNARKETTQLNNTTETNNINNKKENKNLKENKKENKEICDRYQYQYQSRIPLFTEVTNYINEKKLDVDPANFFAYYEEKGWDIVSDWKKAVLGWAKKRSEWRKENASQDDEYAVLY